MNLRCGRVVELVGVCVPPRSWSSGGEAAPQLPVIASRVGAEHDLHFVAIECRVLMARPLQPAFEPVQLVPELNGHVSPRCRPVLRVLAQVDLLAVFTLEPAGAAGEVRWWHHPPVAQHLEQKRLLGLRPTDGDTEVHMMEPWHITKLPRAIRHVRRQAEDVTLRPVGWAADDSDCLPQSAVDRRISGYRKVDPYAATRWTRRQVSTAKRRCSFCSFGPKYRVASVIGMTCG